MNKPKDKTGTSQSDVSAQDVQLVAVTTAKTPATPQATAVDVLALDEHAGKPGSYVFDPETGKRTKAA